METLNIPPPVPLDRELMTVPELADMCRVSVAAVNTWRHRPQPNWPSPFPVEDDAVGAYPVWDPERVCPWLDATGRKYDLEMWRAKKAAGGYRSKSTPPPPRPKAKTKTKTATKK